MEADIDGVMREAIIVVIKLGGPLLVTTLVVGLIISLIQAVTQINEATLAFLPKVLALCSALIVFGPFINSTMAGFMHSIMDRMIQIGSQ